MHWHTPSFWQSRCWRSFMLLPLSWLYGLIYRCIRRKKITAYQSNIALICVGNVVIGGAGKTPTAIALANLFLEQGKKPAFISRGYGGSLAKQGALQVDIAQHQAHQVGDEPLLLARYAPTFVAADRIKAVKLAEQIGDIDVLIMDDGLQNETLMKDCSLLVLNGKYGVGNGRLFPAGPLREPLEHALERVDAVLINGQRSDMDAALQKQVDEKAQFFMSLKIEGELDKNLPYIAFAGIAHPERFFETLHTHGYQLQKTIAFADHYPYNAGDEHQLLQEAEQHNARLVTTEKDWVRLPKMLQERVEILRVSQQIKQKVRLTEWLEVTMGLEK